jgi:hypothetical protein
LTSIFFTVLSQFFQHREVFECRRVARNLVACRRFSKQAAHNFARAGIPQSAGKADVVGVCQQSDFFGDFVKLLTL